MYEQEIAQLEAEQGNKVEFINPEPGFVIKTVEMKNGQPTQRKVFVNMCVSEKIQTATCQEITNDKGKKGQNWQIPYSLGPMRTDSDHGISICMSVDS